MLITRKEHWLPTPAWSIQSENYTMTKWCYLGRASPEETKTCRQNVKLFSKAQQLANSSGQICRAGTEQKPSIISGFNHQPPQPPNKSIASPQSLRAIPEVKQHMNSTFKALFICKYHKLRTSFQAHRDG